MSGKKRRYEGTQEEIDRTIRSLGVLEQLFLLLAAVAALVAGALIAWLLGQAAGLPFRLTWAVSSLALFIVPAGISWIRIRREERDAGTSTSTPSSDPRDSE